MPAPPPPPPPPPPPGAAGGPPPPPPPPPPGNLPQRPAAKEVKDRPLSSADHQAEEVVVLQLAVLLQSLAYNLREVETERGATANKAAATPPPQARNQRLN
ncbi:hypothetical protein KC355_g17686 [Hortaea werneckii]|nr:hypothetical protein KC355_g17686 [Hortaea werneckii]